VEFHFFVHFFGKEPFWLSVFLEIKMYLTRKDIELLDSNYFGDFIGKLKKLRKEFITG